MIEVEGLTKTYGLKTAIDNVTFRVDKGEIVGFLGPNGAGKTSTMRILAGYMPATSGSARVAGYDVLTQSLEARRNVGYLPENVPLYSEMDVEGYLDFAARIRGVPGSRRKQRIDEVMERCHTTEFRRQLIGKLSKGQRQRVGLAQALIHDPRVLILDEPTVGLDPRQIIDTRELIKSLAGEHTVLLSTHILPEVSMTCKRVLIISDGKLIAEDTPEGLTRRLRGADQLDVLVRGDEDGVRSALQRVKGVVSVRVVPDHGHVRCQVDCEPGQDVREMVARTIVQNGWGLLELRPVGMSLEEVFVKLTTREQEASP